jgi:putative inorganic carbon (hco3(-)) transporter
MGFVLFLLTNALFLYQPAAFWPELASYSLYQYAILICLAVVLPSVLTNLLDFEKLHRQPITICVLGLLVAAVLSNLLFQFNFTDAKESGIAFAKIVVYYLVFISLVNTPERLRGFLTWLALLVAGLAVLTLLQYYHVIEIESLKVLEQKDIKESGEVDVVLRLRGIGEFNDPNDFCLLLLLGMGIGFFKLTAPEAGLARGFWFALLGLFGFALFKTQSRGGLLALVVGAAAWSYLRYGFWKTAGLALLAVPALIALAGGRQAELVSAVGEDTGQSRIQLWAHALGYFRAAPLFGIGMGQFAEEEKHVVHNSFLQSFAELGLFGGLLFLGAFFAGIVSLYRLGGKGVAIADPWLARLRPYLLAMVCAYAAGLCALSRAYAVATYLLLGLVTSYLMLVAGSWNLPIARFDLRFLRNVAVASAVFLVIMYLVVRVTARWSGISAA